MAEPTQAEVERIIVAVDRATKESDFAESVKMDTQQIEGTRYKFRLSEESASDRDR